MSKEIIIVLKDGMKYAGNEYRYNHYKRRFELLNDVCIAGAFPPDQIREIRTRLKTWTLTIGNDSYTLDSFDMQYLSKLLKEAGF